MKMLLIRGKTPKYKYIFYTGLLKLTFTANTLDLMCNPNSLVFYRHQNIKKISYQTTRTILTLTKFLLFLVTWKKFRIKYTGKGYRIRRHVGLNLLDFTFGACHFVKTFLPNYKLKLKKKKYITVFYKNSINLMSNFWKITNIKLINLYTQRGLRNSKRITFRKPKSKAAYI